MQTLNLGILAHVDAGKTSLTERLLYDAGVIATMGSVDGGNTQTDSTDLERQRGITIKSAVVSFVVDGLRINLIDTPGHPDFIAEVERALRVLDGVVLVISAVEGVQAQTRILLRTLAKLQIPTLLFVNKIDRMGARHEDLLASIARRLTTAAVPMGTTADLGTRSARFAPYAVDDPRFIARAAEVIAEQDEDFLASYVDRPAAIGGLEIRKALAARTGLATAYPTYFGSAITGAGVAELVAGIHEFLPVAGGVDDGQLRATVFKIDRGAAGEKLAYARVYTGSIGLRDRVQVRRGGAAAVAGGRVTALQSFDAGTTVTASWVGPGTIATVAGLDTKIGDQLGARDEHQAIADFAPPTLETVVRTEDPAEMSALYVALQTITERDPLIDIRRTGIEHEVSVCLYGEVQKQVLDSQLQDEFGISAVFEETRTIYAERAIRVGEAFEEIRRHHHNDFWATIGFRVEPSTTGNKYVVEENRVPIPGAYLNAIEEAVHRTMQQGLDGWQLVDTTVTLTRYGQLVPMSSAVDYRLLTPLVLMAALRRAGTVVQEPVVEYEAEVPADTMGDVLSALARAGGLNRRSAAGTDLGYLHGEIPTSRLSVVERQLPGLTRGEGVLMTRFAGYRPVTGRRPRRPRTDGNPLDRTAYLKHLARPH